MLSTYSTRAPLGGGGTAPPCTYTYVSRYDSSKTERNKATELSEPFPTLILHLVTKGKFQIYDRSAVSDVRVTSYSTILDIFFLGGGASLLHTFKDEDNQKALTY